MLSEKFDEINNDNNNAIDISQKTQRFIINSIDFWYNTDKTILADLNDEIKELEDEVANQDEERISEELGDVIFVLCNFANHHNLDLNKCLQQSTIECQRRLKYIEDKIGYKKFKNLEKPEIIKLWKEAKSNK